MSSLLYADKIQINDHISIKIPTVGEIMDHEDDYFAAVYFVVATPYDMMVPLDNIGIDFSQVTPFDVFCLIFNELKKMDTSLLFGDLDLNGFKLAENTKTGEVILRCEETGAVIDRVLHDKIANTFRKILNIQKNDKHPGNEEAKKYMLTRAKEKAKRQRRRKRHQQSQIEGLIVSLVNTEQFPYNYETVRDLTIYQFYASLKQITHKISFDNTMIGVYAGTVKFDDLKKENRTWLGS